MPAARVAGRLARTVVITGAIVVAGAGPALACVDDNTSHLPAVAAPADASKLLDLVNAERTAAGMGVLTSDATATAIAAGQAAAMATAGSIWHNDAYFTKTTHSVLNAAVLSENVGCNWSIEQAHEALMQSPGHRANILDARLTGAGFAVQVRSDGAYYVVEDLFAGQGASVHAAAASAPAPAAVTTATTVRPARAAARVAVTPAAAPTTTTTAAPPVPSTAAPAPQPAVAAIAAPAPIAEVTPAAPLAPATRDGVLGVSLALAVLVQLAAAGGTAVVAVRRRVPRA